MARRLKRKAITPRNSQKPPFRPENASSLDPAEFRQAFYLIVERVNDETPLSGEQVPGIDLHEARGFVQRIRLTDNPMTRAMLALHELFPDDPDKVMNAFFRYEALIDIAREGSLGRYVIENEAGKQVHEALIEAAAVSPMTKDGEFVRSILLDEAERRV